MAPEPGQLHEILERFDPFAPRSGSSARSQLGRYLLLDVFTDVALQGNQLAVFLDARGLEQREMQRLALELGLSETVFVLAPEHGGDARVRIFTPRTELPFAGHPVLGSAIVLGQALGLERLTLETAAAQVPVRLRREAGRVVGGWMDQPIPTWQPYAQARELLDALGLERSGLPVEIYDNGPKMVYVELADERALAALAPDLIALGSLGALGVNCFAGAGAGWKNRMFAPGLGVSEDPATGSAAGPLALHLARHGRIGFGRQIEISQGVEIGRPSHLSAVAEGSAERVERVAVGGSAVVVASAEIVLRP